MASLSQVWCVGNLGQKIVPANGAWTPKAFVDALNDTLSRSISLFDQFRGGTEFPQPYTFEDFLEILRSTISVAEGFIKLVPSLDETLKSEVDNLTVHLARAHEILAEDEAELQRELEAWDRASERDFEELDKTLE
jgi:hypothetical protein